MGAKDVHVNYPALKDRVVHNQLWMASWIPVCLPHDGQAKSLLACDSEAFTFAICPHEGHLATFMWVPALLLPDRIGAEIVTEDPPAGDVVLKFGDLPDILLPDAVEPWLPPEDNIFSGAELCAPSMPAQ